MHSIEKDFLTHLTDDAGAPKLLRSNVAGVRVSDGCPTSSFRDLVEQVAELGYVNRWHNLLYRGQGRDYGDRNGRSAIYPTIYRPDPGRRQLRSQTLNARFELLDAFVHQLREHRSDLSDRAGLWRFPEYQIALLQHYGLCDTPLLDLTHSLRVAATFALLDSETGRADRPEGYVFALGMPYPSGSVTHVVDQGLVLVKLQAICPPEALRPHFQEGWLAGRLPSTSAKERGDNAARRLLGKYRLDNSDGRFWRQGFEPIPAEALLPEPDPFLETLRDALDVDLK